MKMEVPILNLHKKGAKMDSSRVDSSLSKQEPVIPASGEGHISTEMKS